MNLCKSLCIIVCVASLSNAEVTVQPPSGSHVSLSELNIGITDLTILDFSLQTCAFGYLQLINSNPSGENRTIVLHPSTSMAMYRTCPSGDEMCYNSAKLDSYEPNVSLCQNAGEMWISWGTDTIKAGNFENGRRITLLATNHVIPVADVIISTSSNSTWIFHVDVTTTITATSTTTETTTASPDDLGNGTEVNVDGGNHTKLLTKDNSTANDQTFGILFKSDSASLSQMGWVVMVLSTLVVGLF